MLKFGGDGDSIFHKWKKYGFLEGAKYPERLSFIFENTAILMLNDNELRNLKNFNKVETMVIPILYKLINNRGMSFDTIQLKDLIKDLCFKCEAIVDLHNMDMDAEFCRHYSDTYVKK